jgi:hypothetical protein
LGHSISYGGARNQLPDEGVALRQGLKVLQERLRNLVRLKSLPKKRRASHISRERHGLSRERRGFGCRQTDSVSDMKHLLGEVDRRCQHNANKDGNSRYCCAFEFSQPGGIAASLAAEFTPGEDAALCIIADECRVHGICDLANDAIAARAGGTPDHGAERFAEGARTRPDHSAEPRPAWAAQPDERGANHRPGMAGVAAAGDGERRKLVDTGLTAAFGFKDRLFRSRNRSGSQGTRRGRAE